MKQEVVWYKTSLPKQLIDLFLEECGLHEKDCKPGTILNEQVDLETRDSLITWVYNHHWMGGVIYHNILKANEQNFGYDLCSMGNSNLQYTTYSEGQFYRWHSDTRSEGDRTRKLSFSLQLSSPEDYSGGELQFMDNDGRLLFAPKELGTLVIFDSRVKHRVRKVLSGKRRALVGWVEGPLWKQVIGV